MDSNEFEDRYNFMSMLFSVLAHDLRQPFATIIMTADVMNHTQRLLSHSETSMIMNDLKGTSTKSIELLDSLLEWVKSQKEGFIYTGQHLLLYDLLNDANSLSKIEQQKKDITFNNEVAKSQLIYAHKQMLEFVVRNILSNATKYSPNQSVISANCIEDETGITIMITDQGQGVAFDLQSIMPNIHQNNATQNIDAKGAGIALTICIDMIKAMKGKLWATSITGKGTTFHLKLPATV